MVQPPECYEVVTQHKEPLKQTEKKLIETVTISDETEEKREEEVDVTEKGEGKVT